MDGAALLLLVAGVGFGWQPMPDGSPRYEYIVQVDADLAATLADGQSIPVVGEVPEEIHPIGRVRVVIGDGPLPRERLVTRLKPVGEEADQDLNEEIVVRGQSVAGQAPYNPYGYAAQPPVAQPLATAPAPSGQALFDSATETWNQNVAAPAAEAFNNAGQNFGAAVAAPVQAGVDNAANNMRQAFGNATQQAQSAAASLGDRTKGILDEVARPLAQQPPLTARDLRQQQQQQPVAATTPGGFASAPTQPVQSWNDGQPPATDPLRNGVATAAPQPTAGQSWNDPAAGNPVVTPPVSQPQFYTPPQNTNVVTTPQQPLQGQSQQPQPTQQTPATGESSWNTVDAPSGFGSPSQGMAGAPPMGSNTPNDDPWKNVPDPQTGLPPGSAAADATAGLGSSAPFRGAGTSWPGAAGDPSAAPLGNGGLAASPPNVASPEINRNSFAQAADRPLDGAPAPLGGFPATGVSTGAPQVPSVTKEDIFPRGPAAPATSPLLAGIGQPPAGAPTAGTTPAAAATEGRDNGVIALVA